MEKYPFLILLLAVAGPGLAQAAPRAARTGVHTQAGRHAYKEHLRRADQHFERKEYDQAISEWQAASQIRSVPVVFIGIARAHELAARPAEALAAYEEYARQAPRGPQRKEVDFRIKALRAQLGAKEDRSGPAQPFPYIIADAGLIVGARSFGFDEEAAPSPVRCYQLGPADAQGIYGSTPLGCPRFTSSATTGLRLDVTGFPFARLDHPALRHRALRGLGIGATVDIFFWPDSTLHGGGAMSLLPTSEVRAEVGLRWVYAVVPRLGIMVRAMLQYGIHRFALDKETKVTVDPQNPGKMIQVVDNHGLPEVRYQYLDFAAGARLPYYGNLRLFVGTVLDFHLYAPLSYGEIATRFVDQDRHDGGYGPVSHGYGLRLEWSPLLVQPFRGLTVRVQVYYERFGMKFDLGDPLPPDGRPADAIAQHYARGATDQYFGGAILAGYQY